MAKKRTKIGFDPLAWMKDSPESGVASRESGDKKIRDAAPSTQDSALTTQDSRIDVGEALDLAHATQLHAEFKQALAQKKPLRLDLSRVQSADTAGVQLLLALRRDAEKNGMTATWAGPSRELCAAASQLGLSEALGLPPAGAS